MDNSSMGPRNRSVKLFTELLETSCLAKIESYKGEKIRYVKESLDPPYAEVNTLIVTSKELEIELVRKLQSTVRESRGKGP